MRGKAQQHVDQQRSPNLPADGVGAVADKAAELEGLFDQLEEHFDFLMCAIVYAHQQSGLFDESGLLWQYHWARSLVKLW